MRDAQLVIPQQLRTNTLHLAHSGHQGIVKTKQALHTRVWWPNLDREAEAFVKQCQVCQSLDHGDSSPPLQQNTLSDKPWERLHMDFCRPFPTGKTLLVVIDLYSKFLKVEIMTSTTAPTVMKRLDRIFDLDACDTIVAASKW